MHSMTVSNTSIISAGTASAFKVLFDRPLHAAVARFTGGVSPVALSQAYTDWLQHLVYSPDKQIDLVDKTLAQWLRYLEYCARAWINPKCARCIEPLPQDK